MADLSVHDPSDTCPFDNADEYNGAMLELYPGVYDPITEDEFQQLKQEAGCDTFVAASPEAVSPSLGAPTAAEVGASVVSPTVADPTASSEEKEPAAGGYSLLGALSGVAPTLPPPESTGTTATNGSKPPPQMDEYLRQQQNMQLLQALNQSAVRREKWTKIAAVGSVVAALGVVTILGFAFLRRK